LRAVTIDNALLEQRSVSELLPLPTAHLSSSVYQFRCELVGNGLGSTRGSRVGFGGLAEAHFSIGPPDFSVSDFKRIVVAHFEPIETEAKSAVESALREAGLLNGDH
jgi:hypothetical protein